MTPAEEVSGCAAARIETPRLILRPVAQVDALWIERLAGDWEVARYTARIPHPYPPGGAVAFIAGLGDAADLTFAIERRADRKPVGMIGLELAGREAEVGYWIGKPYWGQGYASEALEALADHGFRKLGLERLTAAAMPENPASIRVQEKNGFVFAGTGEIDAPARGVKVGGGPRRPCRSCWWSRWHWSMRTGACCWRSARPASRWRAYGSSPAASSIRARAPSRRSCESSRRNWGSTPARAAWRRSPSRRTATRNSTC
jgi:RimJ/RimL family protein N-acetyltransferase